MDEKQRLKLIRDFMYLQTSIDQRMNQFITEIVMKEDLNQEEIQKLKDSINYVLDDQLSFIERSLSKIK